MVGLGGSRQVSVASKHHIERSCMDDVGWAWLPTNPFTDSWKVCWDKKPENTIFHWHKARWFFLVWNILWDEKTAWWNMSYPYLWYLVVIHSNTNRVWHSSSCLFKMTPTAGFPYFRRFWLCAGSQDWKDGIPPRPVIRLLDFISVFPNIMAWLKSSTSTKSWKLWICASCGIFWCVSLSIWKWNSWTWSYHHI